MEETKQEPAQKTTPLAAQPDHHHKWNPFVAKRVAMKLASPAHAAPAPAAAPVAAPVAAPAPAEAAPPPPRPAPAAVASPARAKPPPPPFPKPTAAPASALASAFGAPAAPATRDPLAGGRATDGSAAPKPPAEEQKRPEPPSPEALYLRRALPAASPAKPPPPKPTVSPAKPKPRPPPPSPARSSVSWSATPPRKPKAAEFLGNAFDQKHEQPEVAILRHARDVIREAASSLEISITGKKGPTTPRAASVLRPAWASLIKATRGALDVLINATRDEDAAHVADGLLRDLGDYLELEAKAKDRDVVSEKKVKVKEYFDPKKLDVVRGLDDVQTESRLRTLFAMYSLPCGGQEIKIDGLGAHELGAPLDDGTADAIEAYAAALEGAKSLAPLPSAHLLVDVALDARLEALRGRVARRMKQLNLCFALGPSLTGVANALVQSDRPRSSILAHTAALADKRRAARRARGALKAAARRGIGGDDPRVRELERRARQAERAAPASLFNLGAAHRLVGEDRRASECYNAVVTAAKAIGGREGTALVGRALHERAVTAEAASGYHEGAAAAYSQALRLRREALGATHADVAETLWRRGRARWKSGDCGGAREDFEEVLRIREALNEDEEVLAIVLVELGGAAQADSRLPLAAASFDRARRIREKQWGPTHVLSGECAKLGARVHAQLGDHEKASMLYARAYHAFAKTKDRRKAARKAWLACRRESLRGALSSRKTGDALPASSKTLSETVTPPAATLSFAPPTPAGDPDAPPRVASSSSSDGSMDCAVNASWERPAALVARSHSPILVT